MKNKDILILTDKQTSELSVYQLINNEYVGYFDQNIQKIPSFDGFELLLTSQFDVCFVEKEDMNWLIDILNPNQYEKVENESYKTDILYKKDDKYYMLHDTKTDSWYLDYILIWGVFQSKFGDNNQLFRDLTKGILLNTFKCKVKTTFSTVYSQFNIQMQGWDNN